jgi:hypothetical protein
MQPNTANNPPTTVYNARNPAITNWLMPGWLNSVSNTTIGVSSAMNTP